MKKTHLSNVVRVDSNLGEVRDQLGRYVMFCNYTFPEFTRKVGQIYVDHIRNEAAGCVGFPRLKRFNRKRINQNDFYPRRNKFYWVASKQSMINSFRVRNRSKNVFHIVGNYYTWYTIKGHSGRVPGYTSNPIMKQQFERWAWQLYKNSTASTKGKCGKRTWFGRKDPSRERVAQDVAFMLQAHGIKKKPNFVLNGIRKSNSDVRKIMNSYEKFISRKQVRNIGGGWYAVKTIHSY